MLSFSPDSQFMLSCSQDTTTRLWNMETKTNVVHYRGHSFPVWDVEFSSLGFYFATTSHDRSARLWCTNHTHPLRVFAGHLSDANILLLDRCSFLQEKVPSKNSVANKNLQKSGRIRQSLMDTIK